VFKINEKPVERGCMAYGYIEIGLPMDTGYMRAYMKKNLYKWTYGMWLQRHRLAERTWVHARSRL
jgi:hypothetical protein